MCVSVCVWPQSSARVDKSPATTHSSHGFIHFLFVALHFCREEGNTLTSYSMCVQLLLFSKVMTIASYPAVPAFFFCLKEEKAVPLFLLYVGRLGTIEVNITIHKTGRSAFLNNCAISLVGLIFLSVPGLFLNNTDENIFRSPTRIPGAHL